MVCAELIKTSDIITSYYGYHKYDIPKSAVHQIEVKKVC